MQHRRLKPPLTGEAMARGVAGLTLSGSGATVLMITLWLLIEPDYGGIHLLGLAIIFSLAAAVCVIVWALGGVFIALPIWAGLHVLGLGTRLVTVTSGAVLVGLIWFLGVRSPEIAAAGVLAGAVAGWGLWWMAYRRGGAVE